MNRNQQAENYKKYLNNLNSDSKPFMDYNLPKGNTKIKIVNSNVYILDTLNKNNCKNIDHTPKINEEINNIPEQNTQEEIKKDPIQTTLDYVNEVVEDVVEQITDQINDAKVIETN